MSLHRWVNQVGYYYLTKPKEIADDWIYVIDNSIRIENRKVVLILGMRSSRLEKGKYPTYKDLECIEIRLITKNFELEGVIEDAISKTGVPCSICSDEGPDVIPSIRKIKSKYPKIQHTSDIMHKVGNLLKKQLEDDPDWKRFITKITKSKNVLKQSGLSFLCSPDQRLKSRFLNYNDVLEWVNKACIFLKDLKNDDPNRDEILEKLGWLLKEGKNISLFTELFELAQISKEIVRKLHIEKNGEKKAEELLEAHIKSKKGRIFAKKIIEFLKIQCEKVTADMLLLGSSEIIESAFSKLKLLSRECGTSGFSGSIIGLAGCFGESDYKSMAKAFEVVTLQDIVTWESKHIGETIGKKRRQALKPIKKVDLGPELEYFIERKSIVA